LTGGLPLFYERISLVMITYLLSLAFQDIRTTLYHQFDHRLDGHGFFVEFGRRHGG
jgi:hypothetical protein